ncbi:hypothetical protein [Absidia glauca]|uniref:Uncharacterized protein n=1 Tax=Absidia glauca TaxID=4829 RepID=A0A163JYP0_ABSGL|nr:hypothetical protein [Absidia glauca]
MKGVHWGLLKRESCGILWYIVPLIRNTASLSLEGLKMESDRGLPASWMTIPAKAKAVLYALMYLWKSAALHPKSHFADIVPI